jgi:hypothetical protein
MLQLLVMSACITYVGVGNTFVVKSIACFIPTSKFSLSEDVHK